MTKSFDFNINPYKSIVAEYSEEGKGKERKGEERRGKEGKGRERKGEERRGKEGKGKKKEMKGNSPIFAPIQL